MFKNIKPIFYIWNWTRINIKQNIPCAAWFIIEFASFFNLEHIAYKLVGQQSETECKILQ